MMKKIYSELFVYVVVLIFASFLMSGCDTDRSLPDPSPGAATRTKNHAFGRWRKRPLPFTTLS